ncbi:methylglyoxal reductase (NADPH-dependent) gre2 [Serendipita sp. 400]|nr:methylglyoxal reductase (NADPH-dependent) gre2 [Serendipita sp. 400]
MSAVQAPALILVSGGTGFVGSAIVIHLLQNGFSIRAAIRSEAKRSSFIKHLGEYTDSGKLTFVVVPDMTVPGAFKEAVKGVDGIVHTASPLLPSSPSADPNELIGPAIDMTLRVLEDAATSATVKRIVLTSSAVTLMEQHEGKYTYTEKDWFDSAPTIVERAGAQAPGFLKYIASKVLAERAAWAWIKEHNPSYELVTLLPPWIFGKDVFSNPETIREGSSNSRVLTAISDATSGKLQKKDYFGSSEMVDVVDVAEGHLRALTTPEAAGERFALKGGLITWQDIFDIVNRNAIPGVTAPRGTPDAGTKFVHEKVLVGEKAERILGMTYRSPEDTILDTIRSGVELGWKL